MKRAMMTVGVVVLAAGGCHSTEKAPYAGKRDTIATTTTPAGKDAWGLGEYQGSTRREYPQITVDAGLHRYLTFGEPAVEKGEVLKVTVPCRLQADGGQQSRVQWRFIFFGANGVPLRDQPEWRYQLLDARQQVFFTSNSTDTASDWRLEVRSAR